MKKLFVLLVIAVFFFATTKAQPAKVKKETPTELQVFQDRLKEVKSRIFYLKVTLPYKIGNDSTNSVTSEEFKESYFSADELSALEAKRKKIEESILVLEKSSYKVDKSRSKKVSSDSIPAKMTAREYRKRSRSQGFSSLDLSNALTDGKEGLKGLLINDKTNKGESAYFQFQRIDIQEFVHRPNVEVRPNSEEIIFLPMGVYKCIKTYKSYREEGIVHVDPRAIVNAGKSKIPVHFWVKKEMWEY